MGKAKDVLAMAERHVWEFERRVTRQMVLVEKLEAGSHHNAAEQARQMLATFEQSLELARDHLRLEHNTYSTKPLGRRSHGHLSLQRQGDRHS